MGEIEVISNRSAPTAQPMPRDFAGLAHRLEIELGIEGLAANLNRVARAHTGCPSMLTVMGALIAEAVSCARLQTIERREEWV